jgi:hypothetical protein
MHDDMVAGGDAIERAAHLRLPDDEPHAPFVHFEQGANGAPCPPQHDRLQVLAEVEEPDHGQRRHALAQEDAGDRRSAHQGVRGQAARVRQRAPRPPEKRQAGDDGRGGDNRSEPGLRHERDRSEQHAPQQQASEDTAAQLKIPHVLEQSPPIMGVIV